jgi:malate synthase
MLLASIRKHSLGLNCGIWDYAASFIAKFGSRPSFVLPDRSKYVNMERHFLKSYMRLVVRTCHARGAPATGGMAALVLPEEAAARRKVVEAVRKAKAVEIAEGCDGFMVYDLGLVEPINSLWREMAGLAEVFCNMVRGQNDTKLGCNFLSKKENLLSKKENLFSSLFEKPWSWI